MATKFVDSKNFFVETTGASVTLYSTAGIPGSANIETVAKASITDASYFFVETKDKRYCVWFDKTGSTTAPVVSGIDTDNYVKVNVSADTTAGDVATRLAAALDAVSGVSSEVNSDGLVEIVIDDVGTYLAPTNGNSEMVFSGKIKGYSPNEFVKFSNLNNLGKKDIIEVLDVDYNSTTDVLSVVGKVFNKTVVDANIREADRKDFWVESRTFSNWIFG